MRHAKSNPRSAARPLGYASAACVARVSKIDNHESLCTSFAPPQNVECTVPPRRAFQRANTSRLFLHERSRSDNARTAIPTATIERCASPFLVATAHQAAVAVAP
eukprot:2293692-Pleurochrysis_carterae.AAC.1